MFSDPKVLLALVVLLGQAFGPVQLEQAKNARAQVDEAARVYAASLARLLDSDNPWVRQEALLRLKAQIGLPDQAVPRAVELLDETEQLPSPGCVGLMSRPGVIMEDGLRYELANCEIRANEQDLSNGKLALQLLQLRRDGVLAKALVARTIAHPTSVDALLPLVREDCGYVYQELVPALEAATDAETQAALLRLALPGAASARIPGERLAARLQTLTTSLDGRISRRAALLLLASRSKEDTKLLDALVARLRDPSQSGLANDLARLDDSTDMFVGPLAARLALKPADLDDTLDALTARRGSAAPAIPALIALLGSDHGRHDERIDGAIAAIGPKAKSAAPALVKQLAARDWVAPAALKALDAIEASLDEAEWKPIARIWQSRCSVRSFGPHELYKPDCDQADQAIKGIARRSHQRVPPERNE